MSRVKSLNIKYVASQVFYFATFAAMMGICLSIPIAQRF